VIGDGRAPHREPLPGFASPRLHSGSNARALVALSAAKTGIGLAVLAAGFVALSDDDFSRTVIAERFAAEPRLDPSGTSWLPLPFWIAGSVMLAFGRNLDVARGVALVLGVVSILLVHRAALWLGASNRGAFVGALVASVLPTSVHLCVSFQPEALAAGLVVLGAAAAGAPGPRRIAGAAALAAACLCRYEAWPAAAAFAACAAKDAFVGVVDGRGAPLAKAEARGALGGASLVAIAAPLAWVAHGVVRHGDALFFLHRVAAYRRALGPTEPLLASLGAYPAALLGGEPELAVLLGAVLALPAWRRGVKSLSGRGIGRAAFVLSCVVAFLVVGRVLDGTPTHHVERTLLGVWWLSAIVVGEAVSGVRWNGDAVPNGEGGGARLFLTIGLAASIGWGVRQARGAEARAAREPERAMGRTARQALRDGETLLVDTPDYGYFAVIAAFGAPERAAAFDEHDPRNPRPGDAFRSADALRASLASAGTRWFVAFREHWTVADQVAKRVHEEGPLALYRTE
jgi:hypothetical protein